MKAIDSVEMGSYRRRFQNLWESILRQRADASVIVGNAGDKETAALLGLEVDGGYCPLCGHLWKEIRFENIFVQGRYFEPICECYPRCPRCQTWRYEEFSAGTLKAHDWKCCSCGFQLQTDDGRHRYGQGYEAAWAAMTRRQQYVEAIQGTPEQESYEKRIAKGQRNCGPRGVPRKATP